MWAALPVAIPMSNKWVMHPSKHINWRRKTNIGGALWLMINEMSMLTTPSLELLSCIGSVVWASLGVDGHNPGVAFGNLNIVPLGDFHQFAPQKKNCTAIVQRTTFLNGVAHSTNNLIQSSNWLNKCEYVTQFGTGFYIICEWVTAQQLTLWRLGN